MDTVKIRYIGPQTEGLWIAAGEHGAHDFAHAEDPDAEDEGWHEVPVALAVDLMRQREPVPPGEPVVVGKTEGGDDILEIPMRDVWELAPGATLPEQPAATDDAQAPSKAKSKTAKKTAARGR